jgi:hypothetical protein
LWSVEELSWDSWSRRSRRPENDRDGLDYSGKFEFIRTVKFSGS